LRDRGDNARLEDGDALLLDLGNLVSPPDFNRYDDLQARPFLAQTRNREREAVAGDARGTDLRLPDFGLQKTFGAEEEAHALQIVEQFLFMIDVL